MTPMSDDATSTDEFERLAKTGFESKEEMVRFLNQIANEKKNHLGRLRELEEKEKEIENKELELNKREKRADEMGNKLLEKAEKIKKETAYYIKLKEELTSHPLFPR